MRNLVWTAEARIDLRTIVGFIAERNVAAADMMKALFATKAEQLVEFPYIHRFGRIKGTREAVIHPNYIMVYDVDEEMIRVLSIIHSRQQYP